MDVQTALDLIDEIVYKPTWRFSARDHRDRFEDTILVRVDYPAFNTNRADAKLGYPWPIVTYAEFPIVVGDCPSEETFFLRLCEALVEIETHEAREYFRIKAQDFRAPFHPHRIEGMDLWPHGTRKGDLQFGIA